MPEEPPEPPDTPAAWLRYARADLAMARGPLLADDLWELHCYHAQQAAEKAIKAMLIAHETDFPFTHSIEMLFDLVPEQITMPEDLREAARLTDYATASRYPGAAPPLTEEDLHEAVRLAASVLAWSERVIRTSESGRSDENT